ncbi:hypothetical protein [Streptomyces sp. BK205]|uniref:hypothetical protein n=1 Tax=Streptomyces sp. BK205 TaxID=2512164 RepID=UPI001048995A|nr:hypothetical protein [Streptomyces sp. BK205]TCR23031.1 hypothetical protein EV578_104361 [Streptomyces sp. BK205]
MTLYAPDDRIMASPRYAAGAGDRLTEQLRSAVEILEIRPEPTPTGANLPAPAWEWPRTARTPPATPPTATTR